jgi:hypothetical protein
MRKIKKRHSNLGEMRGYELKVLLYKNKKLSGTFSSVSATLKGFKADRVPVRNLRIDKNGMKFETHSYTDGTLRSEDFNRSPYSRPKGVTTKYELKIQLMEKEK